MAKRQMTFTLNAGVVMPMVGLGTYRINGSDTVFRVIEAGLKAGYRAIDTATVYSNEKDIGSALKTLLPKYGLQRKDIFLTSKLDPRDHGEGKTTRAVYASLEKLGTEYLDLYLIHWPGAARVPVSSPENAVLRLAAWKELVQLHQQGLLRAIGVSNFTVQHLKQLLSNCYGKKPDVNQVEYHPHYKQPELLEVCQKEGVLLQAYCSLGSSSNKQLLQDPTVGAVANKLGKTPAQILLCWALQQGIAVIPKSVNADRISSNIELDFDIPENDMATINNISVVQKYAWDPLVVA